MSSTFLSMRQFAKLSGVSLATASRVFSNPETVSDDTLKRVLNLAEEVGFSPNLVAKAAFGESTKSIGVILSNLCDSYFGGIAKGIQNVLIQQDYLPIFIAELDNSSNGIHRLLKHKVDGLIIGASDENIPLTDLCKKQIDRLPVVVIDQRRPGFCSDSVMNDDYRGGYLAGEHLASLGHKRFGAYIYGESKSNCIYRFNGFRNAITANGGTLEKENVIHHHFTSEDDYKRARSEILRMLRSQNPPTAFLAATDYLALNIYSAVKEAGLRIPEDVSVVGFGDLQFSAYLAPPLTTIQQEPLELGRKAAELVLKRLKEPQSPVQEITTPVHLIVRESTREQKGN